MRTEITASEARRTMPALLKGAARGEVFVVVKRGRPIAAIVSASELAMLQTRRDAEQRAREAGKRAAQTLPGARLVVLFGSCARGEANSRSDVDLVVVADVEGEAYWSAWDSLSAALAGHRVDLLLVTPSQWAAAEPGSVLDDAKREGVVLHARP